MWNQRWKPGLLFSLAIGTAGAAIGGEASWPQFHGPTRDTRVAPGAVWPSDLKGVTRVWRVELGPSYSGPIVAGDRVFVTETIDEKWESARAFDRASGRELWSTRWTGALSVPFFAKENGDWIRATPAYDAETDALFVAGMRDTLHCLDAGTGAERWRIDFMSRYQTPLPAFGFVSSPLIDGDAVYVQAGASFCKLDKRTGAEVWRTLVEPGGMLSSAFSSPVIADIAGKRQLLVQGRQELSGVDPRTGEPLWTQFVPNFRGMNILTPRAYGDGVLTSSYQNGTFFYKVERGAKGLFADEAWTGKGQGYMSSPVIHEDFAYLHLGNGRLSCLDLRDGAERWRSEPFGKYWSIASNGDRLLALDQRGELLLIRMNPEKFDLLDRREVSDRETWAHIAIVGADIFIRDLRGLSKWQWGPTPKP